MSLKTPQLTPEQLEKISGSEQSVAIHTIEYEDEFLFDGEVEFKFRFYSKWIDWAV